MESCFTDLVRLHQVSVTAAGLSAATVTWYAAQLRIYQAWCDQASIPDVIPSESVLESFIASQQRLGLKPRTVHARYRALAAVLNFAERRRHITRDQNPVHWVKPPRVPRERPRHVEYADLRAMLGAITSDRWIDHRDRLILRLLYFSGLRLGELCALQVEDIDLQRLEIFVRRGKGAKPRMVPTTPDIRQDLLAYLYTRPSAAPALLLASRGPLYHAGPRFSPEGVRTMLKSRCRNAGIQQYSAHAFRHGFAMAMRNNGADLSDIAAAMGHTSTQVTQMYYAFTLAPAVRNAYNSAFDRLQGRGNSSTQ